VNVTVWTDVFLGIIAFATLVTAVIQVAVIVTAGLAAKRMAEVVEQFQEDLKPLLGNINAIGRDAARATALATAQVERADQLFADFATRVDQTMVSVQQSMGAPAREGRALLSAFRAAFEVLRELRINPRSRQGRGDDEDALFI
jgi:hypothetical protein